MKSFRIDSETWYARLGVHPKKNYTEEILVSYEDDEPEVPLRWYDFNGTSAVRLEVFSDGWEALEDPPFYKLLCTLNSCRNDGINLDPAFVALTLKKLGWEDATERHRPTDALALQAQAKDIAQKLVVQQPDEAIRLLTNILMEKAD